MKKAIFIAKFLLLVFFLHNIGLFSFIANHDPGDPPPIKEDGGREDIRYLNEKMNKANDLGDNYGPEEYFSDLTEIVLKEKEKDFDRSAIPFVASCKLELNKKFHYSLENKRRRGSDAEYGAYMDLLGEARDKYLEITDPGFKQRELELKAKINAPGYWPNLFLSFLNFLLRFYLKNIWLAFFLLWIWWYQDKESLKIKNPFSFLFCWILYPLVIIAVWTRSARQEARVFIISSELRRREKNLFSLFSENEMLEIRRLAKSNIKLSEYRRYLNEQSLTCKHSLLPAMAITLIFLPLISNSQDINFSGEIFKDEICVSVNSPPELNEPESFSDNQTLGIISVNIIIFFKKIFTLINYFPIPKKPEGFKNNPKPIPLFVSFFYYFKLIIFNKQWRSNNETYNSYHSIIFLD